MLKYGTLFYKDQWDKCGKQLPHPRFIQDSLPSEKFQNGENRFDQKGCFLSQSASQVALDPTQSRGLNKVLKREFEERELVAEPLEFFEPPSNNEEINKEAAKQSESADLQ